MLLLFAGAGAFQGQAESRHVDFARDVQPILTAKCGACHSGEKREGGLRLDTRADMLRGGVSGPAIIPGSSRRSLLIQRVSGFRAPVMPASGDHLNNRELDTLRDWIDQGAHGPDGATKRDPQPGAPKPGR
jgi:mono/diheme cytochrome c family protein